MKVLWALSVGLTVIQNFSGVFGINNESTVESLPGNQSFTTILMAAKEGPAEQVFETVLIELPAILVKIPMRSPQVISNPSVGVGPAVGRPAPTIHPSLPVSPSQPNNYNPPTVAQSTSGADPARQASNFLNPFYKMLMTVPQEQPSVQYLQPNVHGGRAVFMGSPTLLRQSPFQNPAQPPMVGRVNTGVFGYPSGSGRPGEVSRSPFFMFG